jgi:GTP pyrophosphokinase
MSGSQPTPPAKESPQVDFVAAASRFVAAMPASSPVAAAATEGREIANIVASLGLPPKLVAAALVYPLVREGLLDINKLDNNELSDLSKTIIDLVQLGRFSLSADWKPGEALATLQSEALRKMLLAVVSDVRIVLVRIAEQLYKVRQARTAPPAEQKSLAIETREIYAALANRLGVWQLKWELEDYAFRFLEPETYRSIATALKETRVEREAFIDKVKSQLQAELLEQGITAEVSGRPKHIYSIWRKMQRKNRELDSLYDIRAVRVLVDDVKDCYAALGCVHKLWSYLPGEFDDYIANPKGNDYQSLHTAVIGPGRALALQGRRRRSGRIRPENSLSPPAPRAQW